jgi:transposase-like protein
MKKQRKHYAPEEKVAILRRHLVEKEPMSKLCDEVGLQPTVFYRWQKEFFENGAAAFEQKRPTTSAGDSRGARPEVGGCAEATADSPPASRLTLNVRWALVLDRFIRTSPRVRSLNFRLVDDPDTTREVTRSGRGLRAVQHRARVTVTAIDTISPLAM